MIALLVSVLIGWLLLRWLFPRGSIQIAPPPSPQITIHIHSAQVLVQLAPEKITCR